MENLKISDLKLVTLLGRFESLRAIARHIQSEPQNLSKKIETIEKSLGKKLIERSSKGISLTSDGVRVVGQTQRILVELAELEQSPEESSPFESHIDIVSRGYVIQFLCPFLVRHFQSHASQVGLGFMDLSPEETETSARNNLVNAVYSFGEVDLGKNWSREKVGDLPYCFAVRQGHPLSDEVSIDQFLQFKMVGGAYIINQRLIKPDLARIKGKPPLRGYDSENSMYSREIVLNSDQIGYFPMVTILQELENNELRSLKVKGHIVKKRPVFMHVQMDRISNQIYRLLKTASQESFRSLRMLS
ncbi:MAG: LysR family transcriptional regulator [Pseudomonadota bacterium]